MIRVGLKTSKIRNNEEICIFKMNRLESYNHEKNITLKKLYPISFKY